jgi:hypothetical protein
MNSHGFNGDATTLLANRKCFLNSAAAFRKGCCYGYLDRCYLLEATARADGASFAANK